MTVDTFFEALERINERPDIYSRYTADALWTSPDISEMMLRFHLDGEVDVASRRTDFIDASAAWMTSAFDLGPGRRVIDLGCGPGLYANRLARSGAHVTGVDFSSRSVDHARETAAEAGVEVEYILADYLAFEPAASYDLAMVIMCDYCALSPGQRARLVERVDGLLEPGGAFVLDVYSLALFETWEEGATYGPGLMDGFWSTRPYFGFQNTWKYEAEKVALEKYVIVEADRTSEYYNWFQHYDPESLTAELAAGGLVVETVLGDVAGAEYEPTAPEFAVVARKPGD
jgi:SAM-dependent methyltransferase